MKPGAYFLLAGVAAVFCSCSNIYTPALYQQDIAYMPKPASFDTVKSAVYISAGVNLNNNTEFTDELTSGQLNLSCGHVFNKVNLAYGAFAVFGDYINTFIQNDEPNYFTHKFFGEMGGRFSANLFVHNNRTDFRYLGIEAVYSHEFGSFAAFRKKLSNQPDYYVDPRTNLFTIGLTTEVLFHNRNNVNIQHGIRGFLGFTPGHNNVNDTYYKGESSRDNFSRSIFPKVSYFIKLKNYFGTIEAGNGVLVRAGYRF